MSEMRFGAKLLPDHENIGKGCGDVGGLIGAFITERLRPAVLMLVADEVAVGVVMALPHVKCVDAPLSTVNDGKGQRRGKSIIYHARFKMTGSRAGQGWRRRRTPMRGWRRTGSSRDRWFSAADVRMSTGWWVDE